MATSKKVLIFLGLFLMGFIVAMTIIFWYKEAVPDTLIQCVLGTGGAEALVLGGIKISKVFKGEKTEEVQPTKEESPIDDSDI